MDGEIIIGTRLETKDLEKDLKREQAQLEKYAKETEKLTSKKIKIEAEFDLKEKELAQKIKEIEQKRDIKIAANVSGNIRQRSAKEDNIRATAQLQINKLQQQYNQFLDEADKKTEEINKNIENLAKSELVARNNIADINKELNQIKNVDNIKDITENIGSGITNIAKKTVRWGVALLGIRSIYGMLSSAASTLSSSNSQIGADIQYIRFALASTLQPVIERIIQLVYKLLSYIGYIAKAWFGVNLFANASTKAFEKNNKALKGSVKSAKELNKQLTGFDEMNVLQDNGNVGAGGGGGGATLPSMDLSQLDGEIPGWIKWIGDNKDLVLDFFKQLILIIGAIKLASLFKNITDIGSALSKIWKFLQPLFSFITKYASIIGGIILIIGGLYTAITGIIEYFKDPSWENFGQILLGIGLIAGGVLLIFGGFPALLTVIIGLIGAVVLAIVKNWESIKTFISGIVTWIYDNMIKPVGDFFSGLWDGFKNAAISAWEGIKSVFSTVADFFKDIFTKAWENVKKVFSTGGKIFTGIKEGIVKAFTAIVNAIITGINKVVAIPFNAINWALEKLRSISILGIEPFGWIKTISVPQIPKLAAGGIVNNPGQGVMMGSYIAGERGSEAVIPLDDQTMNRLGESIARHMSVNLTNINQMNSRVIGREMKKVFNDSDFAYNA